MRNTVSKKTGNFLYEKLWTLEGQFKRLGELFPSEEGAEQVQLAPSCFLNTQNSQVGFLLPCPRPHRKLNYSGNKDKIGQFV